MAVGGSLGGSCQHVLNIAALAVSRSDRFQFASFFLLADEAAHAVQEFALEPQPAHFRDRSTSGHGSAPVITLHRSR